MASLLMSICLRLLAIPTFRAYTVFVKRNSAKRATIYFFPVAKFSRSSIYTAGESDFRNIQFVFEQIIDNLDHTFHSHRFFCDHESAFRVSCCKFSLESRTFHCVLRMSVSDSLFLIHIQNCRKKWVIFAKNKSVVEVLEHVPSNFLDFVARENHIYTRIDAVFHLKSKHSSVAVKVLSFALESVESVGILQIEFCDASHSKNLLFGLINPQVLNFKVHWKDLQTISNVLQCCTVSETQW